MYCQVNVKSRFQSLQRILWRDNPNEKLQIFQLFTVTYGTRPAGFLFTRALIQLVRDEGDSYPLAVQALLSNSYVDDIFTGTNNSKTVIALRKELSDLLSKGCFELDKWCSNYSEILNDIPVGQREVPNFTFTDSKESIKALGMLWCPNIDTILVNLPQIIVSEKMTKRNILSSIANIFDPIGLSSLVTTIAKIFLQDLWKQQCSWDDPLDANLRLYGPNIPMNYVR